MNGVISASPATEQRPCYTTRPLLSVGAAMWKLDLTEDQVLALIESGDLLWAFNIAKAGCHARTVRIWTRSLETYEESRANSGTTPQDMPGWEAVEESIFPTRETLTAIDLARVFNCSSSHLLALVMSGSFRLAKGGWRPGPGGSPVIETASVKAWLKSRRIT